MTTRLCNAAIASDIWRWANAYKVSAAIFALDRAGVLPLLQKGWEIGDLARATGVEKSSLAILLALMEKGGMLERDGKQVALSGEGRRLFPLVVLESALNHEWPLVDRMVKVLRGAPGHDYMDAETGPAFVEKYCKAMEVNANALSPRIARELRRAAVCKVVDLGGADGAMMERLFHLGAAVEGVVIDRSIMHAAFNNRFRGTDSPIQFIPADLRDVDRLAPFLGDADAVIISNVLHMMSLSCVERLVACAAGAATAGSAIYIYDLFDAGEAVFDTASIMTVDWMLQGTGFMMTTEEMALLMQNAGFEIQTRSSWPGLPGTLIIGRKQ